ncbi:MAG: hypothetical protein PHQ12_12695 [Chthoniobacteraceae bacterium]|nr:hypothetical protein [Chthoniobacteraceae bacterium]
MVAQFRSRPREFGAVLFGIAGLVHGLFWATPWKPQPVVLFNSVTAAVIWTLLFTVLMAWLGTQAGSSYVRRASRGKFARAAQSVAVGLLAITLMMLFIFCAGLVVTGDFGISLGVFGGFRPPYSFLQKLAGTGVVFIVGSIVLSLPTLVAGFVWGYLCALLFAPTPPAAG